MTCSNLEAPDRSGDISNAMATTMAVWLCLLKASANDERREACRRVLWEERGDLFV